MRKKIVSIHQPTFFPWYPFFQKIKSADTFVFLTHCQFEKNGYQNRFDIEKKWYTMSTKRGLIPINKKIYINPEKDWLSIKSKLAPKYGIELLNEFDDCISNSLSSTNIEIIKKICNMLEIKTELVLDHDTDLKSTARLVDICTINDCSIYMSGIGGKVYLDESMFEKRGIKVTYQKEEDMIKQPVLKFLSENY